LDKILQQDELGAQYFQAINENLDELAPDMLQLIQKNQIADSDVDMVLRNSIRLAIDTETPVLDILAVKEKIPTDLTGNIGRYFEDVGKVYERNGNEMNIEYCPGNRDRLIEMNTKTVIYIAKQYRNKGVEFEDLIGAGNLGLCIAFDKFKPNNKLEVKLGEAIVELGFQDDTTKSVDGLDIVGAMSKHITYGDLYNKLCRNFKKGEMYSKEDIKNWINKNVTSARFNSVATMWIRACILQEIKNSSLVHKPDSVRLKSKKETGVYNPDVYVSIDRPVTKDSDTTLDNFLKSPDEIGAELERTDVKKTVRRILEKLLKGVPVRDRRIFFEKFGIGLPRPMQPKEIAEQEDLSIARVSQIFQQVMATMKENAENMNIPTERISDIIYMLSEQ
jgi:RNA polymerase sigma factor (sigma-70 family)